MLQQQRGGWKVVVGDGGKLMGGFSPSGKAHESRPAQCLLGNP
jgi:hypothetical protein